MGKGEPRVLVSRTGSAERLLLWDGKSLAVPVVSRSSNIMRKDTRYDDLTPTSNEIQTDLNCLWGFLDNWVLFLVLFLSSLSGSWVLCLPVPSSFYPLL